MKQKEQLEQQTGQTAKDENKQLVASEQVPNTPFHIISHDNGHFLALGNYRLTEDKPTKEDVHEHLKLNFWELLLNVMTVIVQTFLKHKAQEDGSTDR